MPVFGKMVMICILLFSFFGCTVYTEKQTEPVSQVVYATKDSIDKARFDLADSYITEATRLIRPPKTRIVVQHMNESPKSSVMDVKPTSRAPVIIVPERLRGLRVIVVNSEDYASLIQDKESHEQLKEDYANLDQAKRSVDEEIITQSINRDKIVKELNLLKESIINKNLTIVKLSITVATLSCGLIGMVVLKIKGII